MALHTPPTHAQMLALALARHAPGSPMSADCADTIYFRRSYARVCEFMRAHKDFDMNGVFISDAAWRVAAWYHRRNPTRPPLLYLRCAVLVWLFEQGFDVADAPTAIA